MAAGRLTEIYNKYKNDVAIYIVYIREAHAIDSRSPSPFKMVQDPINLEERSKVAKQCVADLNMPMPALVDRLDDKVNKAYKGWPDRLYLIGKDGRLKHAGGRGPFFFSPDEWEKAIVAELAAGKSDPVRQAAMDYVLSLYNVEPERIERSVDPKLAKVGYVKSRGQSKYRAPTMTFDQLKALAGRWNKAGKVPKDAPQKVEVLGALSRVAIVKLTALWGVDYMSIHKTPDGWKIRNVMWQRQPAADFQLSDVDRKAILQAGHDYVDSFYQAKPELVDRSVSKGLVKFGYYTPKGSDRTMAMPMSFAQLRNLAATLHKSGPPEHAPKKVEILDAMDRTAALKVVGAWGTDFMHVAKIDGKWQIVHVLWQS